MHASLNVGYQGKSGPGKIREVILVERKTVQGSEDSNHSYPLGHFCYSLKSLLATKHDHTPHCLRTKHFDVELSGQTVSNMLNQSPNGGFQWG